MKGLVIREDGTHETIELDRSGSTAETIRGVVGGWFECYSLDSWTDMWANEEAKYAPGLQFNPKATWIFRDAFGINPFDVTADFIMGNVLLTGGADDEGDTVGLEEDSLARYITWLAEMDTSPTGLPTLDQSRLDFYRR